MNKPNRTVPTQDLERWIHVGWAPIRPAFDPPNTTIIRWDGVGQPQEPPALSEPKL